MKKRHIFSADRILSMSAIFMSFCTFIVLIYQTNLNQEKNELILKGQKASAMPYLILELFINTNDSIFSYSVMNKGLGPAFVQSAYLLENSKKLDSGDELLEYLFQKMVQINLDTSEITFSYTYITKGKAISPNEHIELFSVKGSKQFKIIQDWFSTDTLSIVYCIRYSSIYGEQWQSTRQGFLKLSTFHRPIPQDSITYYDNHNL